MKTIATMTHDEFMGAGFEVMARFMVEKRLFQHWDARAWLERWAGSYGETEALEAARGKGGRGWVWGVEWSTRTWLHEVGAAIKAGAEIPEAVRDDYTRRHVAGWSSD